MPGNVGQHIGRFFLARKLGIDPSRVAASIALEPVLLVVGACICSVTAFKLLPEISLMYGSAVQRNMLALAITFPAFAVLALIIPWTRKRIAPLAKKSKLLLSAKSLSLSMQAVMTHVGSFSFGSISLWLTIGVMSQQLQVFSLSLLGIYAIAWLIGFVVPGAPAGLGVREALLIFGLTPLYGAEIAATSTALFRLNTVLGDGITYLLGLLLRKRSNRVSTG